MKPESPGVIWSSVVWGAGLGMVISFPSVSPPAQDSPQRAPDWPSLGQTPILGCRPLDGQFLLDMWNGKKQFPKEKRGKAGWEKQQILDSIDGVSDKKFLEDQL